jgi:hypothetical protein
MRKRFGGDNPNSVVGSLFDLNDSVSDSQTKYHIDDHKSLLIDYRLLSQPPKKYKRNYLTKPFKERLVGTLNRMMIEGGHSPELLETIVDLILTVEKDK